MNSLENIPLAISTTKGNAPKNLGSEVTNMYVQMEDAGGKSNHILINSEGYSIVSLANYLIFGMYAFHGYVYIATSQVLYRSEIRSNNNVNFDLLEYVGDIAINQKAVFSDNGIEVVMVAKNGYAYNPETEVFEELMVQDGWYDSSTVAYMDGYFIFNRDDTGQFFISKPYSTELNPLDWATGESAPDDTVGVIVAGRQLWILGERSTEVWYDSGDPLFPFTRVSGAVSDIGCISYTTIETINNSVLFVGDDRKVYLTSGYTPQVISTPAIETMLETLVFKHLKAFAYHIGGEWRYVLHIDEHTTMSYDIQTQQWTRRASKDIERWAINGVVNMFESNYVFGFTNNEFARLSMSLTTENGEPVKRQITSLPLNNGVNRFRLAEVQLDAEVGEGDAEEEDKWWLQASKDGTYSFGTAMDASMGSWGEGETRIRWLRLGMFRDCTLRFTTYTKKEVRLMGLYIRRS